MIKWRNGQCERSEENLRNLKFKFNLDAKTLKILVTFTVIYADFSRAGSIRCFLFGDKIPGRNEILLLDEAMKFGIIFQYFSLIIKNMPILSRKFQKNTKFSVFPADWWKIRIIIYIGYN